MNKRRILERSGGFTLDKSSFRYQGTMCDGRFISFGNSEERVVENMWKYIQGILWQYVEIKENQREHI